MDITNAIACSFAFCSQYGDEAFLDGGFPNLAGLESETDYDGETQQL
jgi:hypothetical protein